jgi:hypothetical protein
MSLTSVQTTITNDPTIGAPGMLYDSEGQKDVVSCRAQEAIPFGAYVRIIGGECELADSSAEVTADDGGVALHGHNVPTGVGYAAGDMVPVLRSGRVWVTTEDAIANGAQPFIRFTTNSGNVQGNWRGADADTARAVQKPGITMYRGNGAAGLAVVQLNGRVGS